MKGVLMFLEVLKLVSAVAMSLRTLITAAETLFPGDKRGMEKLSYVKSVVTKTAEVAGASEAIVTVAMPVIEKSVEDLVAVYKKDGTMDQVKEAPASP